jgi:excisionase family DNA binding protein
MGLRKNVLTTGEVARICNVAPRTVSKWFDSGRLRGYRIPGSKDRRIPLNQLIRFMRAHGIPMDGLEADGLKRIVVLDADEEFARALGEAISARGEFEVFGAQTTFEAGFLVRELRPNVLLVDVNLPGVSPKTIYQFLRSRSEWQDVCLIGVGKGMSEGAGQGLLQDGFDAYLSKPFDVHSLLRIIEEKMEAPVPAA